MVFPEGWVVEKKNTATLMMKPVDKYMPRPYDDEEFGVFLFPSGSEHKRVCSWTPSLYCWNQKYRHIKIQKKGANTCTDCHVLTNKFRMRRIRSEDEKSGSEIEDDELNESANDLEAEIENGLTRSDLETVIEAHNKIGSMHQF
eukprot:4304586-Ditylum_brightwellii.AAC.1